MTMPERPGWGESPLGLERLVFFSDAVFAIAITLLVLELRVPELPPGVSSAELARRVLGLWHEALAFVISFLVIGIFWARHHQLYHYIMRVDGQLLWLNLLVLLCVAFLPFPTALLSRYNDTQFAVAFYAGYLALVGLLMALLWIHAATAGLVAPDLDPRVIRHHAVRLLGASAIFLLSIGVSFASPVAAHYCWALIALVRPLTARLTRVPH